MKHTLEEINTIAADWIRDRVLLGYKIVPGRSICNDTYMYAFLRKDNESASISTILLYTNGVITKYGIECYYSLNGIQYGSSNVTYYHAYDDVYSDSENEAKQLYAYHKDPDLFLRDHLHTLNKYIKFKTNPDSLFELLKQTRDNLNKLQSKWNSEEKETITHS